MHLVAFATFFCKGDHNFCDSLAFLHTTLLLKRDLLLKARNSAELSKLCWSPSEKGSTIFGAILPL